MRLPPPHEECLALPRGRESQVRAVANRIAQRSNRVAKHREACAAQCASGKRLRDWRGPCLLPPHRRRRNRKQAAKGFPWLFVREEKEQSEWRAIRLVIRMCKSVAGAAYRRESAKPELGRSWRSRIIHGGRAKAEMRKSGHPRLRWRRRTGSQLRQTPLSDNRVSGPFAAIGLNAIHDAEDDVCNPPKNPEEPEKGKEEDKHRRRPIRSVSSRSAAEGSCKDRNEKDDHPADEKRHVAELPDERLQGVEFYEAGILLNTVNDERRDETRENLKQMSKKCHGALILRRHGQGSQNRLIRHGFALQRLSTS